MFDLTSLVDDVLVQTTVSKRKPTPSQGTFVRHHQHHRHQQPALQTSPLPPSPPPPPPQWYTPAFGLWLWVWLREYDPIDEKDAGPFLVEM
jgi:hypothetical protein